MNAHYSPASVHMGRRERPYWNYAFDCRHFWEEMEAVLERFGQNGETTGPKWKRGCAICVVAHSLESSQLTMPDGEGDNARLSKGLFAHVMLRDA